MVIFETERLLFRSHTADDRAQFIEMHTDPQVRRFVGGAAWSAGKARARFRAQYLGKPNGTYGLRAAVAEEGNVASERILAKLGFQEVRVERIGPRSLVHYLLKNELQ